MREYPDDYCPCPDYPETCTLAGEWLCYTHAEHELPTGADWCVCFECQHIYRTAEEVVDEYRRGALAAGIEVEPKAYHPLIEVERIHFCPLCLHDW